MRFRGHPVHLMLIHFPVGLWPAHAALHCFRALLPAGVAGVAGFWCLAAGTALGWLAAACGLADLLELSRTGDDRRLRDGLTHGLINGTVLAAATILLAFEYPHYPAIAHGPGLLGAELLVLVLLGVGNFFGGEIIWRDDGERNRRSS
ncbi:MAG TPA: DUF2231 domain-containing protein [Lacunisphaera sp.]|nr:DUF2231 domain-containing protein [Lacunisphaera sp.]